MLTLTDKFDTKVAAIALHNARNEIVHIKGMVSADPDVVTQGCES